MEESHGRKKHPDKERPPSCLRDLIVDEVLCVPSPKSFLAPAPPNLLGYEGSGLAVLKVALEASPFSRIRGHRKPSLLHSQKYCKVGLGQGWGVYQEKV